LIVLFSFPPSSMQEVKVARALDQATGTPDYRLTAYDLARCNRELEQRLKECSMLLSIGRSVASSLDLDVVLNRVTEAAVFITGAEEGYLLLLDERTGEVRLRAAQNLGERRAQGFSLRVEDSIAEAVIKSGKPVLLDGNGGQNLKVKIGYMVKSVLNVPLKVRENVVGVLGVDNQVSPAHFTLAHLHRLSALANLAAPAVENARQYTVTRDKLARRAKEIATLQTITAQLSTVNDLDAGMRLALSLALKAADAEAGALAWIAGDYKHSTLYVSQGSLGESVLTDTQRGRAETDNWWDDRLLHRVIETGQLVLNGDLHRGGKSSASHARSRMVVPMHAGREVVGAINLESSSPHAFTQDDLRVVSAVADQAATTLAATVLREKAEAERERLSLLIEEATDNAIWVVDADMRLIVQNEAASRMLNQPTARTVGRSLYELRPLNGFSPPPLYRLLSQAMEEKQLLLLDQEVLRAAQDGDSLVVRGKIVPIIHGNRAVGAICACRDISSEKNTERAKSEFATMASHLLRSPLSAILAAADLLVHSKLDEQEQQTAAITVQRQGERIKDFVKGLLDISQMEGGSVHVYAEPVALPHLVERALNLVREDNTRHVFTSLASDTLPLVTADPGRTELVLLNLLRGAIERCPDGGHIAVEVKERIPEVIVSVEDDGQPISTHQLDMIFWQFYPADGDEGKVPSTYHLGLYTTKRLVELQGGRVWAQSQPGHGSRFSFSLPVWGVSQ
jgi:PAS domain S-box-containing protein